MTDMRALRVSLGPVQGFISSGRRTRDFWAGSFLLSWLSGIAMKAVIDAGGAITIPVVHGRDGKTVTEPTLKAIMDGAGGGALPGPLVGTLVNHFRAEVPSDFDISLIEKAVRSKLKKLACEVYKVFIRPALTDANRKAVLKRWLDQTDGSYFEILAVMGDAPDWPEESQWLERRKMLRTHAPLMTEPGADHCPVHGDLAELGGFSRQYQRNEQIAFWKNLRKLVGIRMYEGGGAGGRKWTDGRAAQLIAELKAEEAAPKKKFRDTLEIRESERLSGMALVKRLWPLLHFSRIAKIVGWMPDHIYNIRTSSEHWHPKEAQFAMRNWPSTAFIAAIPWIVKVGNDDKVVANSYAEAQYSTLGADPIWNSEKPQRHRIKGVDMLRVAPDGLPKFAIIDGTLHFERGLEKHRFDEGANADTIAAVLQAEFKKLIETVRKTPAKLEDGPASTHYAMLDMDGDGMGKVFSHSESRAKRGSTALLEFSANVAPIIRSHDGILIYAGADDVNAMLPIETAIPCAQAINKLWAETMQRSFVNSNDICDTPTLSGSIVFADYQNALDDVRRLTHERLDKVAKDDMGRNALALAVMKSGGVVSEWASSWYGPDCRHTAQSLFDYARAAGEDKTIASRLPYLIRQRFGEVLDGREDGAELFNDGQIADFLKKEISDSILSGIGGSNAQKAQKIVEVLRPYYRPAETATPIKASRHIGGLLVARFLAKNCMWSYFDDWENRFEKQVGGTP